MRSQNIGILHSQIIAVALLARSQRVSGFPVVCRRAVFSNCEIWVFAGDMIVYDVFAHRCNLLSSW
jgi:hypothetical protein